MQTLIIDLGLHTALPTYIALYMHVVQNHKLFKEKEVEGKYSYLNTLLLIFLFSTDINLRNWQVFFAHTMDMMDESQLSTTKLGLQCVNWWNNFLIQFQHRKTIESIKVDSLGYIISKKQQTKYVCMFDLGFEYKMDMMDANCQQPSWIYILWIGENLT